MKSIIIRHNKNKLGIVRTDDALFKFINPNENTLLSCMSQYMQDVFFELLIDYKLEYRTTLNLKKTTTFGYELEFENADIENIRQYIYSKGKKWMLLFDTSLKNGGEIPTPIFKDKRKTWTELKNLCEIISNYAIINDNCRGHIHIGKQVLGESNKSLINFLKIWSTYEHIIYHFSYGENNKPREAIKEYAKPISHTFWQAYNEYKDNLQAPKEEIIREVTIKRNVGASLRYLLSYERPDISTIEFRCPNGTFNPIIWQNNTNLFVKLLEYCKSPKYNSNIIETRHEERAKIYSNLDNYNVLYLKDAIELSDLIFTNNLDKIYFLKQYIK